MAESKRAHRYLKGSLKFLVITTLVIIVSYGLLNVVAETQETATALLQAMGSIESKLRYLRWLLLAVIIIFWDEIIQAIASYKKLDESQTLYAKNMRWRIAAYIIAFDIFVVEALPAQLLS